MEPSWIGCCQLWPVWRWAWASRRYFSFAVVFAASQSFLSPIDYQTNRMVFGPGNYRFLNFLHFG
jgi:di/tricarboxylate transporter